MNRRGFMGSILALGAAPAIVRADALMRVRPRNEAILGTDGFLIVTPALQNYVLMSAHTSDGINLHETLFRVEDQKVVHRRLPMSDGVPAYLSGIFPSVADRSWDRGLSLHVAYGPRDAAPLIVIPEGAI